MAGRFSVEAVFKAVDRITAPVTRMQNRVGKFTRSMSRGLRKVNRLLSKTVQGLGRGAKAAVRFAAVGLGVVTTAVGLLVREFSKLEDAEAAFTPVLGGAKRAKELVEALNKTAATTPFQFETLAKAANQLLPVMNGNIEDTIKNIRNLGDTAGGNAQKLDSITRGFTKAMLKGRVDMESLNIIAEAGVPIFNELADSMGVKVNKAFFKMISAGRVTTQQLTKAFEKMTSKGGTFFQGMEIASKTTSGLFSTLKDNISLTAAELGSVLAPTVKELIRGATSVAKRVREWVKNNKELIREKFVAFVEGAKTAVFKFALVIQNLMNSDFALFLRNVSINFEEAIRVMKQIAGVIVILVGLSAAVKAVTLATFLFSTGFKAAALTVGVFKFAMAAFMVIMTGLPKALALARVAVLALNLAFAANPVGLVITAIAAFIALAAVVITAWDPVTKFFSELSEKISGVVDGIGGALREFGDFFGFGDGEGEGGGEAPGAQVVSPQARIARSVEEQRSTSTSEVTIKDESGRAEVTGGKLGAGLSLQKSGAF